jgi:hypothetical protein
MSELTVILRSYITSILGFKLSLLFSFLRIAAERSYKNTIIGIMVACTAFNLSFLLVQLNLCTPVSLYLTDLSSAVLNLSLGLKAVGPKDYNRVLSYCCSVLHKHGFHYNHL